METILSKNKSKPLLIACCGMDLCWLFAWANFMTLATTTIRFPMWGGLMAFFGALGITYFFITRSYRRIWLVLVHACCAGFLCRALLIHLFDDLPPQTNTQWYQTIIVVLLLGLFWYKGTRLATRSRAYKSICNHFDLGISLLFILTCIKFILELKVYIVLEESFTFSCIGAYFSFGLIALFLSYNEMGGEKTYLKGYRTYGILISATFILLLVSMGSFLLFQPLMTAIAESVYAGIKTTAGLIDPFIKSILLFLFRGQGFLAKNQAANEGGGSLGLYQVSHTIGVENPILIGILIFLFSVILCLICYLVCRLVYRLFLFLISKPPDSSTTREDTGMLSRLFGWIVYLFQHINNLIRSFSRKIDDAGQGFVWLLKWGKRSGVAKERDETPLEYAIRLQHRFKPLENEIRTIISAFQLEIYGQVNLAQDKIQQVTCAVKTIHHPSFWLMRIKSIWEN